MSRQHIDGSTARSQAILALLPRDSPLHRYVQWACSAHGSPPIYHLGCALAVLLYELSWRGFRLQRVIDEGEYPLTAQFLLLGRTHTGKSTAFFAAKDFVQAVWARTSTRPAVDPWLELEGSIEGITSAMQERYDDSLDLTPVLLYDPEISKVFARREPLTELLCKLADARTIQLNYRGKQRKIRDQNADRIVNPRVSGIFCTTEAQLIPHFKEQHRMGGIFPRMIWLRPEFTRSDIWLAQDHDGATSLGNVRSRAIEEYSSWIVQLELAANGGLGRRFAFTAQAHALLQNELFTPFADTFAEGDDEGLHGVKMRLIEKARVFAALHAAFRLDLRILPEDVEFAIGVVKFFMQSIIDSNVIQELGADDGFRAAKRVEMLIRASGDEGMLKRELYHRTRFSKAVLEEAIAHVLDQETVFQDNSQLARAGRYLHVDSQTGQEIRAVVEKQRQELGALHATLGQPSWHGPAPRRKFN